MKIGSGEHSYHWIENWARIPETSSGKQNGRTHAVVVNRAGEVIVFSQADPAVLFFGPGGNLLSSWGDRFPGAHGLTLVEEDGQEFLWLTDHDTGEVVKTTLDGRTLLNLGRPDHPIYRKAGYAPTWVAVNEERFGGNGDIWVTDGYGSNCIHRYDKVGNYAGSINGEEGEAGAFDCPHALWNDTRGDTPELYIADRGNHQIQVYDLQGNFKRSIGRDILSSPCGFTTHGSTLLVPELYARLAILDENDEFVCYLGRNEEVVDREDWPDLPPQQIKPGKFNSPHDLAVDSEGNLYVAEWIVGGRISKLAKC
jgi:hypothetical protein